jgi:hypothetical protein
MKKKRLCFKELLGEAMNFKKNISHIFLKDRMVHSFYIQLFVQEIQNVQTTTCSKITSLLDVARQMLDHRNHFEHWQTRLKKKKMSTARRSANSVAKNKAADDLLDTRKDSSKTTIKDHQGADIRRVHKQ